MKWRGLGLSELVVADVMDVYFDSNINVYADNILAALSPSPPGWCWLRVSAPSPTSSPWGTPSRSRSWRTCTRCRCRGLQCRSHSLQYIGNIV